MGGARTGLSGPLAPLVLLPAAILLALALGGPLISGDLWWHLSTGRWILEHGELPRTDPFSHTAGERPWTLEEYGSQVLFAWLYDLGGLGALRVVGTVLGLALLLLVYRMARRGSPAPWAAGLTVLFAVLYALKWELRPHLLSAFFFFRLVHVLFPRARDGEGSDPGPRVWLEVLVLTAIWTQLHAESLFAPLLGAAGLIGACIGAFAEREGGARRVRAWLGVFVAGSLGVLISPFGTEPLEYALLHRSVPQLYIEEWFKPFLGPSDPGFAWYRPWFAADDPRFAPLTHGVWHAVLGCFVIALVFGSYQAWRRRTGRRSAQEVISWERIGLLAFCFVMALQARRFFWLLWFPVLDAVVMQLRQQPRLAQLRAFPLVATLLLTIPLYTSFYVSWARDLWRQGEWSAATSDELFPLHATNFVAEAGLEGNLYHPYHWGGFLGWWLGEKCPVFIDGRTVLFEDVIPERWRAQREPEYAREVFERREVRILVFDRLVGEGAASRPWKPPGAHTEWIRVWADEKAAVWVHATDSENMERVVAWYRDRGIDFRPERGFNAAQVIDAQREWLDSRSLLPELVAEPIRASYGSGAGSDPEGHRERAEIYRRFRLGRAAAWEERQAEAP